MSTREVKRIAQIYTDVLKKQQFPFLQVYLFGSFVTGAATEDSDIDMAVITKRTYNNIYKKCNCGNWLLRWIVVSNRCFCLKKFKIRGIDNRTGS